MNIFKEKIIKTTAQVAIVSFVVVLLLGIQITVAADNNTNENVDNGSENVEEDMTSDEAEEEDSAIIDLNSQIEQRKRELDKLNNEHEKYRKSISIKQQEAITLESQLSTLDDNISKTEIDIQITETEIDTLKLQIREVDNKIAEREKQIDDQKDKLSALIRQLNTTKDTNLLEILLKEDKFSEFFNQVNYLEELEHGLKGSLDDVKQLKLDLEIIDEDLAIKNEELNEKKDRLDTEIVDLDSQKDYKIDLLDETKSNEADFQELLNTVKREQMSISSEIDIIEDTIRKKLEGGDLLSADDSATLSWPVSPVGGITAYFHDPSYPFRYIFEHPAIDLRA
ncbi:hypothetical protein KKG41_03675, partial [Patescibacteria group bacterium]|nr:hypothetical protein [Patescibacteria group bacterium]